MKPTHRIGVLVLVLTVTAGCSAIPEDPAVLAGYAKNSEGRAASAAMCKSVRRFVRAPLDPSGLRRVWFLPFGIYDDGSFDFYAPMASDPSDDASKVFYRREVGQLTHYLRAPDFAAAMAGCLTQHHGFARVCQGQTEETFRATFRAKNGRLIEIAAAEKTTSLLIAEKEWSGNLEQSLAYRPSEERPNKSMQPTCEDARG